MTVRAIFGGEALDATPDQFTFTDVSGINPSTVTTSGTVTVTGLSPNIPISVTASGGTVDAGTSALSGTFASSKAITTSATGTFVMAARATSSASFSTAVNVVVTVNGVSDTYTVTTRAADTTPDAFTFTDKSSADLNTIYSTSVNPSGYDYASWSVSGGEGSTDNSTWTTSGTINSGQTFYIRGTSSSSYSTAVNVVGTIGGVSDTYTITTRAADTSPDAFSFTNVTNAELNTIYTSETITVTGFDPGQSIDVFTDTGTVDAGTSSLSGTFEISKTVTSSASGTIVLAARKSSDSAYSSSVTNSVNVEGVIGTFTVTTKAADITPDPFSFTDITGADLNTVYTSNTLYVTGMSPSYVSVTVTATGGTVDAGTYALSGTFSSSKSVTTDGSGGFYVAARVTSSGTPLTATDCTVNINGVADTYTVTTGAVGEIVYSSNTSETYYVPISTIPVSQVCMLIVVPGEKSYAYTSVNSARGTRGGGLFYINNWNIKYYRSVTQIRITFSMATSSSMVTVALVDNADIVYGGFYVTSTAAKDYNTNVDVTPFFAGGALGSGNTTSYHGGGGGAAGYAGNGGDGAGWSGVTTATAGSGGGGGGGGRTTTQGTTSGKGAGGGGVGLYGQGSNGAGGTAGVGGGGGSGGSAGSNSTGTLAGNGGDYGGGAAGSYNSGSNTTPGRGAVRIIWGGGRSFPNNAT